MLLAVFQTEPHISVTAATLIGIVTIALGVAANVVVANRNSGKFEGKVTAYFESVGRDIERIDEEQTSQWRVISDHTEKISELRGRLNASKGHHG